LAEKVSFDVLINKIRPAVFAEVTTRNNKPSCR